MPRNFAATAPGGRPATSRSVLVPGPGDPGEDDLLKARQATLNTAPFTVDHRAAYAAYVGITDRATALDLHRHHVTWDDVADYSATGLLDGWDYRAMKALRQAGATPADAAQWQQMADDCAVTLTVAEIVAYATARLRPAQVRPYYAHTTPRLNRSADQVAALAAAGLSPGQVLAWQAVGVHTVTNITYLHQVGCDPQTVTDYLRTCAAASSLAIEHAFTKAYTALARAAQDPALTRTALLCGVQPAEVTDWLHTGEPVARIDLFLKARISATEWHRDPTVREADTATIAMLAALHGHSGLVTDPPVLV